MSDFTTEQLGALKEGAPPGPWEWYWDQGIISLRGPDGEPIATDLTMEAADALAASRALVDSLIAEKQAHQRIRTGLEQLLDTVKYETRLHDDEGKFPETVQLGSYVTSQLTRILEADNG